MWGLSKMKPLPEELRKLGEALAVLAAATPELGPLLVTWTTGERSFVQQVLRACACSCNLQEGGRAFFQACPCRSSILGCPFDAMCHIWRRGLLSWRWIEGRTKK